MAKIHLFNPPTKNQLKKFFQRKKIVAGVGLEPATSQTSGDDATHPPIKFPSTNERKEESSNFRFSTTSLFSNDFWWEG